MTEGLTHRRFTVADIEAMVAAGVIDEHERVELINGELVPMSPKGNRHEDLKSELNMLWCGVRPKSCSVTPETTFRLSDDTYLEPDFVVYDRSTVLNSLTGGNVLLVVEIADSSLRYDIGRKAVIYAGFGVRELWVIDVVRLTIRVFREPAANGFGKVQDYLADAIVTPLVAPAAFTLRLADLAI